MDRRVVLTFHGTGAPPSGRPPDELRLWVPLTELCSILDAAATVAPAIRVTFDDGNASDVQVALPELLRRDLSATFFVVTGWLDRPSYLGRPDLATLTAAGMTIGSHGAAHRPWRGLQGEALREEAQGSRELLEDVLGADVEELALPFGSYDRRALAAARRAGYRRVYTSDGAPTNPGSWLVPRTTVAAGDGPAVVERALRARRGLAGRGKLLVKRWR